MEYGIVITKSIVLKDGDSIAFSELAIEVNKMIGKGWEPIGGISVIDSYGSGCTTCSQAMVRMEENEKL